MLMGTVLMYHQACHWLVPALPQTVTVISHRVTQAGKDLEDDQAQPLA